MDGALNLERRDVFSIGCVPASSHRLTSVARVVASIISGVFGFGILCMMICRNPLVVVLAHRVPSVLGTCWPLSDFCRVVSWNFGLL